MSCITTFSGLHFDPVAPEASLLKTEDIAHALSLICRANGHFRHFYSVAQHSLACAREAEARGLSPRIQLACLLHDASEAYLSDVTRPVKEMLTVYLEVEKSLQETIWNHYLGKPLTEEEMRLVSTIDDEMLSYEFLRLMPETINERYKKIVLKIDCAYREMAEVEAEFVQLTDQLQRGSA